VRRLGTQSRHHLINRVRGEIPHLVIHTVCALTRYFTMIRGYDNHRHTHSFTERRRSQTRRRWRPILNSDVIAGFGASALFDKNIVISQ
jgi:hypothetical protein